MRCLGGRLGALRSPPGCAWRRSALVCSQIAASGAEDLLLQLLALLGRQGLERLASAVQLVEPRGPLANMRAALEHLHLDPQLEHVGRRAPWRRRRCRRRRASPGPAARGPTPRRLVHRAGEHVGRAQGEGRGHGRRACPARRPRPRGSGAGSRAARPPRRAAAPIVGNSALSGPVVGVPAGVRLDGDVLGHRQRARPGRPPPGSAARARPAPRSSSAGGGSKKRRATSGRETLAKTWLRRSIAAVGHRRSAR